MEDSMSRTALRTEILEGAGAHGAIVQELLAYNENKFDAARHDTLRLPLDDEPHLAAWDEYKKDAATLGVIPALRRRLVQLQFPIEDGISQTDVYRAATRRGELPAEGTGPDFANAAGIELVLHPTVSGRVPLLIAADRRDFVTLVRVFSERNEPAAVPDSMGACIVTGLNNWDRVAQYRRRFEAEHPEAGEDGWLQEFRERLVPRKDLYQDRFIILSRGAYSAVPAADAGLPEAEWLRLSLSIREEHECTHYFTCRVFGSMRNNLLDEIIADFAGLMATQGRYDGALALRFFGLENHPQYREGGRLQSYLGKPPLSAPAVSVLRELVVRAIRNIEAFVRIHEAMRTADGTARMVVALTAMTLEELASPDIAVRLSDALEAGETRMQLSVPGTDEGTAQLLDGFVAFAQRNAEILRPVSSDICVVLDEVVSNIVKYGYENKADREILVVLELRDGLVELDILDEAPEFNPLERADPKTDQALEDRPIGGLGIHIVKKLMDEIVYRREGGRNHLVLRKRLA